MALGITHLDRLTKDLSLSTGRKRPNFITGANLEIGTCRANFSLNRLLVKPLLANGH